MVDANERDDAPCAVGCVRGVDPHRPDASAFDDVGGERHVEYAVLWCCADGGPHAESDRRGAPKLRPSFALLQAAEPLRRHPSKAVPKAERHGPSQVLHPYETEVQLRAQASPTFDDQRGPWRTYCGCAHAR